MNTPYIIGINGFHDASVALLSSEQSEPIAIRSEDRHSGKPHHYGFPHAGLQQILEIVGDPKQIAAVAMAYDRDLYRHPPADYFSDLIPDHGESHLRIALESMFEQWESGESTLEQLQDDAAIILEGLSFTPQAQQDLKKRISYLFAHYTHQSFCVEQIKRYLPHTPIHFHTHHRTHAATYLTSPYEKAAVITWDGRGEFDTTVLWRGTGDQLTRIATVQHPWSLGTLYEVVCEYLGFDRISGPGKVMGLAAYGDERFIPLFKQIIQVDPAQFDYRFNPTLIAAGQSARLSLLAALTEQIGPARAPHEPANQPRFAAIARGIQAAIEEAAVSLTQRALAVTGCQQLVLSGGLSLNCVMNEVIRARTGLEPFLIPPSGDDGTALGAALLSRQQLQTSPTPRLRYDATYGSRPNRDELLSWLAAHQFQHRPASVDALADLLAEDALLGVMQGAYEIGPRALGFRSILANPTHHANWHRINKTVKFREDFRPFAPVFLKEEAQRFWGDQSSPTHSPWMLLAPQMSPTMGAALGAVTHVDGTARVQTLDGHFNPSLHQLLTAFKERTGVGCLLNTSLNMAGESILTDFSDLIDFMAMSELDGVVIEDRLILKAENGEALQQRQRLFTDRAAYRSQRSRRYDSWLAGHDLAVEAYDYGAVYRQLFPAK
uniref:Carbamoyltransferase n=1 Tax=Magnetococcus massalia (strain MO-1) TaxID=451514 RepID=A0A1S7LR13_MAGMO|nr:Protein of unknown function. Containing Actin-like ATPase domain [Candidatus Magnetococcus massalia]